MFHFTTFIINSRKIGSENCGCLFPVPSFSLIFFCGLIYQCRYLLYVIIDSSFSTKASQRFLEPWQIDNMLLYNLVGGAKERIWITKGHAERPFEKPWSRIEQIGDSIRNSESQTNTADHHLKLQKTYIWVILILKTKLTLM